jgi:DNA repair exonuclease SbcCD ATPase subunit
MDLIRRLQERVQQTDAELKQRQADAERQAIEARELEDEAERLQQELDQAEKRLATADQQCERLKSEAAYLCDVLGDNWGRTDVDGTALNPPVYSNLVSIEAAVADFLRVRKLLQSKVSLARTALREFVQQHAA